MGQISYFFLKTLRQNPTDWLYHVFSLGHMCSSSKEKVLWLSTPYFYAAHTQVMHYWHSQRTTSSVKGLEQLFLSIATTPLCCQHCRKQVQTIFPRDSAVLDPKSSCRHRCSKKKNLLGHLKPCWYYSSQAPLPYAATAAKYQPKACQERYTQW